jgi:phosphate transport system substrate-binding protein
MNRDFRFLALVYLVLISGFNPHRAQAGIVLQGGGATFPYPLYAKWFAAFSQIDKEVDFNYQRVGSGEGQRLITNQFIDFGASDAPMSSEALANAPGTILHVPTVGGATIVIFNLPQIRNLRLDGPTLAAIYLGKITQWNDPAIVAQNPQIKLPDEEITTVHRSDDSGTTYIFTSFLTSASPEWKLKVGRSVSVTWLNGVGLRGSDALTSYVKHTPGAIGYVELAYAAEDDLPHASIKNSAGNYVQASTESIAAALSASSIPDDFRLSLVNAPGPESYPIAGVTWLLVFKNPGNPTKTAKLVAFLKWAETEGQKMASDLDFAPLPETVTQRVLTEINTISARN